MTGQESNIGTEWQRTTIDQGQQALQQAIEFQRNAARMALTALEWQQTAQRQGLEMTESLFQNYLQSVESAAPEMERAMEQGVDAVGQGVEGFGGQGGGQRPGQGETGHTGRSQSGGQQRTGSRQMGGQSRAGGGRTHGRSRMEGQQGQMEGQQGQMKGQQGQQMQGRPEMGGRPSQVSDQRTRSAGRQEMEDQYETSRQRTSSQSQTGGRDHAPRRGTRGRRIESGPQQPESMAGRRAGTETDQQYGMERSQQYESGARQYESGGQPMGSDDRSMETGNPMNERGEDRRETAGRMAGRGETDRTGGGEMQGGGPESSSGRRHQTGEWVTPPERTGSDPYRGYEEARSDRQQGGTDRQPRREAGEYGGERSQSEPQSRSPSGSAGTSGRIETPRAEHRTDDETERRTPGGSDDRETDRRNTEHDRSSGDRTE